MTHISLVLARLLISRESPSAFVAICTGDFPSSHARMKGIIALRMCDMSKYGGLPLEYGTVPAPVWRNIHPRLQMGTAARARAGVGTPSPPRMLARSHPGRGGQ